MELEEEYAWDGIYVSATGGYYKRIRDGWLIFGREEPLPHDYPQQPLKRVDPLPPPFPPPVPQLELKTPPGRHLRLLCPADNANVPGDLKRAFLALEMSFLLPAHVRVKRAFSSGPGVRAGRGRDFMTSQRALPVRLRTDSPACDRSRQHFRTSGR